MSKRFGNREEANEFLMTVSAYPKRTHVIQHPHGLDAQEVSLSRLFRNNDEMVFAFMDGKDTDHAEVGAVVGAPSPSHCRH